MTSACSACGRDLPDHANFCRRCGAPVATATDKVVPPALEKTAAPGHQLPNAGEAATVPAAAPSPLGASADAVEPDRCPSCGGGHSPGAQFCRHCGSSVASPADVSGHTVTAATKVPHDRAPGVRPDAAGGSPPPTTAAVQSSRRRRPLRLVGLALLLVVAAGAGAFAGATVLTDRGESGDTPAAVDEARSAGATPEPTTTTSPAEAELDNQPLTASSPLSTEGLGPVLAGMSLEEAEAAADTDFVAEGPAPNPGCRYFSAQGLKGVTFMVSDGEVARVDVQKPSVATLSGVRVGDAETEVLDRYGDQISVAPADLNPSYNWLTFTPRDRSDKTRMIFTTDGSRVTSIQAGRLPEVEYVEGCV